MKLFKLHFSAFILILTLAASCSSPKTVFYFQNNPAVPQVMHKAKTPEPVYSASTNNAVPNILPASATVDLNANTRTKPITKKEMRKLLRKNLVALRDTTPDKKVTISADKEKIQEIKSEVENLKKSVKVERAGDEKVVVNYQEPRTQLSGTTKILLAVAAVLVLAILFSIPVLGGLLAFILGLAVVAVAVALILGVIEIRSS